jgi:transaldolase
MGRARRSTYRRAMTLTNTETLHHLAAAGQSIWIDTLSRDLVRGGELRRLVADAAVTGVTSNPTIFERALARSEAYDEQLAELSYEGTKHALVALMATDVQDACDVLEPVFLASGGTDGFVSLEVDPALADDVAGTLAEARRLRAAVDRPNMMVKIPATDAGVVAFETAVAEGMAINMTLVFSPARHLQVAEAYVRGLARLVDAGGDPAAAASVASLFVSRIDSAVDPLLVAVGAPAELRGQAAIANAKIAHLRAARAFQGPGWEELVARGARPQRSLWASTSTKDPRYRDVRYVESLIGPQTVSTMPLQTLEAFADHGTVAPTLGRDLDAARAVLASVQAAGVDLDGVLAGLETEGVALFAASFAQAIDGLARRRAALQLSR